MSYTQDLLNLAMEANGIVAGITANTTAISAISVGNSTVNSTINSTALAIGSNTATFGTAVYHVANGNVGIGTSTPTYLLDAQNSSTAVDYIAGRFFSAAAATGESQTWLKIEKGASYGGAIGGYISQAVGSGLILGTQNGVATPVERMRITNAGNVGIGTTTPSNTLSVTGTVGISGSLTSGQLILAAQAPEGGQISFLNPDNSTTGLVVDVSIAHVGRIFQTANNSNLVLGQLAGSGGVITLYTAASERMRIDSAGNIGIGNTAPGSKLTISGGLSSFEALLEKATVSATAATGTVHLDVLTQAVLYYTSNATANFTLNVRANSSVTANSILVNGQSLTVAFLNTTGATAYYPNVFSIDSTTVVPKYSGGTAYVAGNANSVDSYTFTIIKTANSTYTVLANQTQYK